jgi:RsiW-degrading membrane proteinase PrsW (M82 family)
VIAVLLVGAFTVPVAFVSYFYERERKLDREVHGDLPLGVLMVCFLVGGALGVTAATILEFATLRSLNIPSLFVVGLIEESVKLILPVILFIQGKYRSESDGLLFGVASGMGFAGLETMGYGMTTLIGSQGNINALDSILLIRGILSPAGHAAWTGLICALIWRGRGREGNALRNFSIVIGAYILAIVLHASWDIMNSLGGQSTTQLLLVLLGNMAIAFLSLFLLFSRVRESARWQTRV